MHVALYQPDIAQNVGTIFRTAACLGAKLHIIEPCGFPFDERKFRRAGMDYIDKVDYLKHVSWENFVQYSSQQGLRIILLSSKVNKPYYDLAYKNSDVVLFGRETAGVPEVVAKEVDVKLTIPMVEGYRSLNVAVSAAVVMGEIRRQLGL